MDGLRDITGSLDEIVLGERERFLDAQPGAPQTTISARTGQP